MAHIMDGKKLSDEIKKKVKTNVQSLEQFGIDVGLGLLLAGEKSASRQYLNATLSACKRVGIKPYQFILQETASINELLNTVNSCVSLPSVEL